MPRKSGSRSSDKFLRPVSHWDKLDRKWQHTICLIFLFLLPLFQYPNVIPGNERFMAHDIVQWRASAESVIEHREEFGEEPLWAPNMFSGMPAYVISVVRSVPHIDSVYTWLSPVFPAAPLWIMMLGMYLFLLRLKLHPLAATLGALLIALTTYLPIIVGAGHNAKVYALSFIPWMLYGFHLLTRSQQKWLGFAVFALAVNLELRAGHPQVTYFFLILFALWWIHDLLIAAKKAELPGWAGKTGLLIAAGLLALAANAQPFWSLYEYSPYSIRGGTATGESSGLDMDYAMAWSHGWFEMSTFIIPNILGGASPENMYWGEKSFTSGPHYLGALVFFLVLLALFRVKSSLKWVFLSTAILTMLFALGKNFSTFNNLFFNYFPFFDKFRAPEMWLMVTSLSFNVLAAMGAHWLFSVEKEGKGNLLKKLDWPAGLTIATSVVYLILIQSSLSFEKPGERMQLASQVASQNSVETTDPRVQQVVTEYLEEEVIPLRKDIAQKDALRFMLFVGIGIVLTGVFLIGKIPAWIALTGFLVLLIIDLVPTGNRYISEDATIPKAWSLEEALERQRTEYHTFIQNEMEGQAYPYRVFPVDANPFNNAVPAYFYPSVGGYTGAKMNRYQAVIDQAIFSDETGLHFGVMDMLNVKYITARQPFSLPNYEVAFESENGVVMENTRVLPKVFFPKEVDFTSDPSEALTYIRSDFDASERTIIETNESLQHIADSTASLEITEYIANRISFQVTKSESGWMVLSEMFYPKGWIATVNGEETPVYAANYILRAIYLEPGEHSVEFVFKPASYSVGSTISWVCNILILGIFVVGLMMMKKPEKPDIAE